MKTISFNILLFLIYIVGYASDITGIVYLEHHGHKELAVGANVYWASTTQGVFTNAKGEFSIAESTESNLLIISFIGYASDTIKVIDKKQLNIVLKESVMLEEVVKTARSKGTHVSRLNPIHTIEIGESELRKAACCNLSESFETNAAADVNYNDAVTGAKQIQMLGLSGNYVQMLAENIPIMRGLASPFGLGYIPGPWMSSIQISKGTSAVKNGFEAVTGQINVEFKKPIDKEKFHFNAYGDNTNRIEASANGTIRINKNVATTILAHANKNELQIDENHDNFLDLPLKEQFNFFNRWYIDIDNKWEIQLGVKALSEDITSGQLNANPLFLEDTANGYHIGILTQRAEAFSKIGYLIPNKWVQSVALISNVSMHDQQSVYGNTNYNGYQESAYLNGIFESLLFNDLNKISTGISLQYDDYVESLNDSSFLTNEVVPGLYFEHTYTKEKKITIISGLRADHHNLHGLFFTPRMHVKYYLDDEFYLRLSGGKAYRTSNILAENSYLLSSSRQIIVDKDLPMEEALNLGVNVTRYFDIAEKELRLSVDYYRTDFQYQVIVDMDSDIDIIRFSALQGKSYSNSAQLEANYELIEGLDATAALRYTDVKQTIGGKLMQKPFTSLYKGLITASYMLPNQKWQFDVTSQFNGGGRIPSTSENPVEYQRSLNYNSYTILNSQLTRYFKYWNIYLGVENITDFKQHDPIIAAEDPFGEYFDGGLVWGPIHGRKIYAGVRVTF